MKIGPLVDTILVLPLGRYLFVQLWILQMSTNITNVYKNSSEPWKNGPLVLQGLCRGDRKRACLCLESRPCISILLAVSKKTSWLKGTRHSILHSLKLTACPWKKMLGKRSFPFGALLSWRFSSFPKVEYMIIPWRVLFFRGTLS